MSPYANHIMRLIYCLGRPITKLLYGYFPNCYGMDGGIYVTYWIFDLVEKFLGKLVILDYESVRHVYLWGAGIIS